MANPTALVMDYQPVAHAAVETRAEFIRKTYLHVFGAIGAFVALEAWYFTTDIWRTIFSAMGGSWLLVLGGFILVSWLATHIAHSAKSLVAQYAALSAFVVAESLVFVPLLAIAEYKVGGGVVASAAAVTLAGFAGLTAIAVFTGKDFSFLGGILRWCGFCALGLIVAALIFDFTLGLLFSVVMVAFAGGAILYDTSNILHHYPKERYVGAALQLFASVAMLFWYVLRIFTSSRD